MSAWKSLKESFAVAGEILFGKGLKNTLLDMNERQWRDYKSSRFGISSSKPEAKP